jgi:hypothetical protein
MCDDGGTKIFAPFVEENNYKDVAFSNATDDSGKNAAGKLLVICSFWRIFPRVQMRVNTEGN